MEDDDKDIRCVYIYKVRLELAEGLLEALDEQTSIIYRNRYDYVIPISLLN